MKYRAVPPPGQPNTFRNTFEFSKQEFPVWDDLGELAVKRLRDEFYPGWILERVDWVPLEDQSTNPPLCTHYHYADRDDALGYAIARFHERPDALERALKESQDTQHRMSVRWSKYSKKWHVFPYLCHHPVGYEEPAIGVS